MNTRRPHDDLANLDLESVLDVERWSPTAGNSIHFVADGFTFPGAQEGSFSRSEVSSYGQTVVLTDALLEASRDRHGFSFLDLADDPGAQEERWGREMFRPGPAPASMGRFERGSVRAELERDRRKAIADRIADDDARIQEYAAIEREFGRSRTSRTLSTYRGGRFS